MSSPVSTTKLALTPKSDVVLCKRLTRMLALDHVADDKGYELDRLVGVFLFGQDIFSPITDVTSSSSFDFRKERRGKARRVVKSLATRSHPAEHLDVDFHKRTEVFNLSKSYLNCEDQLHLIKPPPPSALRLPPPPPHSPSPHSPAQPPPPLQPPHSPLSQQPHPFPVPSLSLPTHHLRSNPPSPKPEVPSRTLHNSSSIERREGR